MNVMTTSLQKKVCILGAFSVGKTSLVKRFVDSIFSEAYITTVGVKVDKKMVNVSGRVLSLILWDVAGEDDVSALRTSYLRGSAGFLLVADGTRRKTLETAQSLRQRVEAEHGALPFALLLNKSDLKEQWAISGTELEELRRGGWWVRSSSARTGEGVDDAFHDLAVRIIG